MRCEPAYNYAIPFPPTTAGSNPDRTVNELIGHRTNASTDLEGMEGLALAVAIPA